MARKAGLMACRPVLRRSLPRSEVSVPLPLTPPRSPTPGAPRRRRRSVFGRVFRGAGWLAATPVDWLGTTRIRRSWSFIGDLVGTLRRGPVSDRRFKTADAGVFDVRATAFSYGVSVPELEARLRLRRPSDCPHRHRYVRLGVAVLCRVALAGAFVSLDEPSDHLRVLLPAFLRSLFPDLVL